MPTQTAESQSKLSPKEAIELLKEGNNRFVNREMRERDLLAQVEATSKGQFPFACVVGCIDSRVPATTVFDQGIGSLFVATVAGNIINEDILGSLEFGCAAAGSKAVVVLGHTSCGAVKGACDKVELGNLTSLLSKINPALLSTTEPKDPEKRTSKNLDFVNAVARKNVLLMVEYVRIYSNVLRSLEETEKIKIIGAMYDISTGAVEFLNETMN
ncbi:MAG: carbonic anhydrase family protein [Bacteroidetes bacterium]|nr:carbonic anhydrase family protein [Bacteroidota bacterium]